jgi:hypothetical protein
MPQALQQTVTIGHNSFLEFLSSACPAAGKGVWQTQQQATAEPKVVRFSHA